MAIDYSKVANGNGNLSEAFGSSLSPTERLLLRDLQDKNSIGNHKGGGGIGKAIRRNPGRRSAGATVAVSSGAMVVATLVPPTALIAVGALALRLVVAGADRVAAKDSSSESAKRYWTDYAAYDEKWKKYMTKFGDAIKSAREKKEVAAALQYLCEALHYAGKRNQVVEKLLSNVCNLLEINSMNFEGYLRGLKKEEEAVIELVKELLGKTKIT